jgi:outer membrane receptor protein involved in Fe transport
LRYVAHLPQPNARDDEETTDAEPEHWPRRLGGLKMSKTLRLRSYLAMGVSAVAIAAIATPTFAQEAAAPARSGSVIEELVVTAQKREEAIQDVPIAVSAFSQDSLEKAKIDGGPNLQLAIPNVAFSKGNFTGFNFQIRGVGSKLVAASGDAGTGIHLNNVPLTASNLFEAEFYDVERVEVLRGPQGTLYGRNATGGVVNVITAKPVDRFTANIKGELGNFNTQKVRGMINVPLGDKFAVRLAGSMLKRDGFGDNLVTGNNIDDRDLYAVRATVSFNPSEKFSSYLMLEHFEEDDSRSRVGKQFCVKDTGAAGMPYSTNATISTFQRGFLSQGCQESSVYAPGALGTPNSSATLGGLLGNLSGLITGDAYAGKMQSTNLRDIESLQDPIYRAKTDVMNFQMSWDVTDDLTLTSLTGYSKGSLFSRSDYNRVAPINTLNATPVSPGGFFNDPQVGRSNKFATFDISSADSKQWSQELRLQSAFSGPLNFNVGAIMVDFKSESDYYVFGNTLTGYAALTNLGAPCVSNAANCIYIDPNQTPTGEGRNYYDNRTPYELVSTAVFGEVYYEVSDSFKLTGGLRYTHDSKETTVYPVVLLVPGKGLAPDPLKPTQTADFKEMTGRIGFDWKPDLAMTDSTLIYAFYSRGYKAGGMNPPQSTASALAAVKTTFDPEFVNSFEVGMKNTMLDGSLIFNATVFNYDYVGYQVSKIVNRTSVNENIDAKIQGLEIESIWEPINNLRFNASLGLLKTEIGDASSIDTFNRTQGDPSLVVIKASNASNCTASKAGVQGLMTLINAGALAPTTMLGVCSGAFTGAANPLKAFGIDIPFSDGISKSLKGNQLPNSPEATLSLGAQYSFELPAGWAGTLRGDYYKQGKSYSRIYNSFADRIDSWENVNATLQISNESNGIQVEAYVKNLLDDAPLTDLYLTDDSSGLFRNGFLLEPRTYGISIQKSF